MKKSIWDDHYSKLRKELKKIRKRAGLTQIQLAEKLEKPQSYVSKYEIGDRNLDFIEVIYVCNACNENPENLLNMFKINS
ncbi:MAG: helix-turn-helix transcriptional regulator [Ignavibacteriae bacterium]|nr:helix-turn-helix transcriptional regulator [Ignavibacteriota bacterium]